MDLKSVSNVHFGGNCTTQDTCAYIVCIANEVEPTGRCGIHYRAPVEQTDVFFISYSTVTKLTFIYSVCGSNEIPKRINFYKNGKNVLIFISMITNLPGAPGYKWDH